MFGKLLLNVREKSPLVQVITNFVTVNDCANIILAAGASPTMAHDIGEVEEIASVSSAMVLNIGTVEKIDSMILGGKKCNELSRPVVLDPVAAGASRMRSNACADIIAGVRLAAIRGNISEIKALATGAAAGRGVDAAESDIITEDTLAGSIEMAKALAARLGTVIAISGKTDIITDGKTTYIIRNGHEMMARITGTGCMLTALCGAFCGANPQKLLEASAAAVAMMGVAGERAYEKTARANAGTLTFRTHLIDEISLMTPEILEEGLKLEQY